MIYTFYSYKGGVGRSMALANAAELFYQAGKKVLMVDWDLEAPGLERYFPHLNLEEALSKPGVIDMLLGYKKQMEQKLAIPEVGGGELPFAKPGRFTLNIYEDRATPGQLLLLPAGYRSGAHFAQYAQAVHEFDWNDFYLNWEGELYFDWLYDQLAAMADVVLIDSRTGVTEMSGVCTQHLADIVVMFCTPNQQSLDGTSEVAQNLKRPKLRKLRGDRSLEILVVPARVEDRAEVERLNKFEGEFTHTFDGYIPDILKEELATFWDLKIPHVPYYAFDETVAVREKENAPDGPRTGAEDMIEAFERLTEAMAMIDPDLLPNEEAVDVYLAKKAWNEATSLLDNYDFLKNLYKTGQAKTLDDWLSKLPLTKLEEHPELLILWGMILNDDFGHPKRAMTFFKLAEEQFRKRDDGIGVTKAQIWQSVGLRMMGRAIEAVDLASNGLEQLKSLAADNSLLIAWATRNRGLAYGTAGNFVKALSDTHHALEQFEKLGDKYMTGLCHHDIGVSLEKQANISEAEHHYRLAIDTWRELGNSNSLANTLIGLGKILCEAGHYDEALERLHEGLDIALEIKATRRAAFAQAGIGDVYFALNEYEEAVKAYLLSNGYAQDAQVQSLEIANQIKLSECYYYPSAQHDLTKSLELATQAQALASENGLIFEKGLACVLQAKIYIRSGEYETSFKLLKEAAGYFAENDVQEQIIETEMLWAYSLWLDKKISEAFSHLQKAVKLMFSKDNLMLSLRKTLKELRDLLVYFLNRTDAPANIKERLKLLVEYSEETDTPK